MPHTQHQNFKTLEEVVGLFQTKDSLSIPLATGQPMALLKALGDKTDWEELRIHSGLMTFPYSLLMHPNVKIISGYYGPLERMLNEQGANVEYMPSNFRGFEWLALKRPTRIIATTVSAPDEDGYVTFGTHGAAIYNPFVKACQSRNQIAIAEINPQMPLIYGDPKLGDNKIHMDDIDIIYEADYTQATMPEITLSDVEDQIAKNVIDLIDDGATLQFGIGGIPNRIADLLVESDKGNFGIHSELISDGFLHLLKSGKITNKNKGIYEGQSVFTFAFGAKEFYQSLDEKSGQNNRQVICLPVTTLNDPAVIAQNNQFTSINSGLMIDFNGQVASEAIGLKQYSGVGGQLSFVEGAYRCPNGKTIICIKSTATVNGKRVSNIQPTLPLGSIVSTPRHFVQYIVTEHGVANLYGIPDEERAKELIKIADPEFRDELLEEYEKMNAQYYHFKG